MKQIAVNICLVPVIVAFGLFAVTLILMNCVVSSDFYEVI